MMSDMPDWAARIARVRRGCDHPYATLDAKTTALVVIDMQNAFMIPEGAASFIAPSLGIVPNVNRLAAAMRKNGGRVVWVQNTYLPETVDQWSTWFGMNTSDVNATSLAAQSRGSIGQALYADMDVRPEDVCIEKHRFSAFMPEGSDLAARLRAWGCDTVVIVGIATNVCCESSARDAAQMNFRTIMVDDATATTERGAHVAALATFYSIFGDVQSTDDIIAALDGQSSQGGQIILQST